MAELDEQLVTSAFTPGASTLGGMLIGVSAALLLLGTGQIAGVTGILGGALQGGAAAGDRAWRLCFLAGLIGGGAILSQLSPEAFADNLRRSQPTLVVAGLLVGFGTRLGNGCTSGHGVCGVGRFSKRSLVATLVFVATGMVTVLAGRLMRGGNW